MDRRGQQNQEGYVLITALVALAVLAILATATIARANSALRMAAEAVRSEQALYMANAGVEQVLAVVGLNQEVSDGQRFTDSRELEPGVLGSYAATVTLAEDGVLQIRSTGRVEQGGRFAARLIEAAIAFPTDAGGPGDPGDHPPTLIQVGASARIENNALICGDLYVVGNLELGNNSRIGATCSSLQGAGRVIATKEMVIGSQVQIAGGWCAEAGAVEEKGACGDTGGAVPAPQALLPPTPPPANEATSRVDGDLRLAGTPPPYDNAIIYIEGDLEIGASASSDKKAPVQMSGQVTFVVTGETTLYNDLLCTAGSRCQVQIFTQALSIPNNAEVWANLHPSQKAEIGNNVSLYGDLVTRGSIQAGNSLVARGTLYAGQTLTVGNGLMLRGRLGGGEGAVIGNNAAIYGSVTGGHLEIGPNLRLHPYPGTGHPPGGGGEGDGGEGGGPGGMGVPGYIRWQQ